MASKIFLWIKLIFLLTTILCFAGNLFIYLFIYLNIKLIFYRPPSLRPQEVVGSKSRRPQHNEAYSLDIVDASFSKYILQFFDWSTNLCVNHFTRVFV